MKNEKLIEQALSGKVPKWCKHIHFWSRPGGVEQTFMGEEEFDAQGGWGFETDEAPCGLAANDWKFCPICGTPHPK